jgi:carbon monoxide dehydrogenase subunit G
VSELVRETVAVAAPRDAIWALLDDPAGLARVLPGAESLVADGPDRWTGVLASRVGFLTIRADAVARVSDIRRPEHMRLEIEGRPRGLAGSVQASIPFDLAETPTGTQVAYTVDLTVTGRLAAFGLPILRDTLRKQVAQLVASLERELGHG